MNVLQDEIVTVMPYVPILMEVIIVNVVLVLKAMVSIVMSRKFVQVTD